jgi:enoyl-CoA hydratase/carnithine racemase
MSSARAF